MKLIFTFSIFSFLILLVSYPYLPSTSGDAAAAATFSLIMGLRKGLGVTSGATTKTTATTTGPFTIPDFKTCRPGIFPDGVKPINCCPPVNTTPAIDFSLLPPPTTTVRVRRPVHLLDDEYLAKFKRAVQLMKELPDEDPRSFKNQANIHCAHCLGGHRHPGYPELTLEVHASWLFHPFHRMYMYFFERILGKLIDDPTFALPFWNWDSPEGMHIPESFADVNSPLYEEFRDKKHQPPVVINLGYNMSDDPTVSAQQQTNLNLIAMYEFFVSGHNTSKLFYGASYHPGDAPHLIKGTDPHTSVHYWVGSRDQPNGESMGPTYTAGRDPLFYSHHSNMDRIWTVWKTIGGGNKEDLTDPDWLNTEFMFYDEEARLVKVKVQDVLDITKLGYMFEDVDKPWLNARPTPHISKLSRKAKRKTQSDTVFGQGIWVI